MLGFRNMQEKLEKIVPHKNEKPVLIEENYLNPLRNLQKVEVHAQLPHCCLIKGRLKGNNL